MDTSAARMAIFGRIRKAQQRPAEPTEGELAEVQHYLSTNQMGPRPKIGADIVHRFRTEAERTSQTIDEIATLKDAPEAAARYLDSIGVARTAIAWETLTDIPWAESGLHVEFRPPVNEDLVGITSCFCAVAETGTLMMLSGAQTYASATLLPETHIVLVPVARIVRSIEDGFDLAKKERGVLPRATNFISGPSRTGDIEQTIVLGAHGPYRVHLILVRDFSI
ncbi:MAG: lactate utilization protein C [Oxalobacteraceae bacterium]|jgi:L-lactate dehydrogenase complex protein LldG|nr:lactate utilization protein C [Oxalobacteraceae bacterium]